MKKSVVFALLVAPIFYSGILPVTDMREQQFFVCLIVAAFLVAVNCFNKIVGYGLIYCLLHLALFQRPAYINNMVQIVAHILIYDLTAKYFRGKEYKWPLLTILGINLVMAWLQYIKQDVYLQIGMFTDQLPGLMTLPVYIGIYAAVTAPVLYAVSPWLIILSLAGVIISKSSFAAIAFYLGMLVHMACTKSRILTLWLISGLVGVVAFIFVYDGPTGQFERRLHIWKMVGSAIAVNPWGGWGIGSYDRHIRFVEIGNDKESRVYAAYQPHKEDHVFKLQQKILDVAEKEIGLEHVTKIEKLDSLKETKEYLQKYGSDVYFWQDPHNGYILAWFEGGLPLLMLIIWYIVDMTRRFRWYAKSVYCSRSGVALFSSFVAVVVITGAHFAIQLPRLSVTIMILLGILDQTLKRNENLSDESNYVDIEKW